LKINLDRKRIRRLANLFSALLSSGFSRFDGDSDRVLFLGLIPWRPLPQIGVLDHWMKRERAVLEKFVADKRVSLQLLSKA
jgi:hypothetical protein